MSGLDPTDEAQLRDWYASITSELDTLSAGEIIASWRRCFRPTGSPLTRPPTPAQIQAQPDRFFQDERGHWYGILADPQDAESSPDHPRADRPAASWTMSPARGGVVIRTADGRTFADREAARAAGLLEDDDPAWLGRRVDDLLPSGRRSGASPRTGGRWRKGVDRAVLARTLLVASLAHRLGKRPAARLAILWDAELGTPLGNPSAAELVKKFQAGRVSGDQVHDLETAILTASDRVWKALGFGPESRI